MQKIICIIIGLFLITTGLIGVSQKIKTDNGKKIISLEKNDFASLNLQGNWVYVRNYNNYAPNGMPDFDQEQDEWKKIINYINANGQLDTTSTQGDDLFVQCLPPCIAPGVNAHLETTPVGGDREKFYFCGPTAAADVLWWTDSKVEKNGYPDGNADTCTLVTNYSGITDDHHLNNVRPLIEDIAINWTGTALDCTTSILMMRTGLQDYIDNKTNFQYTVSSFTPSQFNINNLWDWIKWGYGVILLIDSVEGGHWIVLNGVNKNTHKIQISDPDLDIQNPTSDHSLHNDASIVSHDTYSLATGTLHIQDYIGLGANITAAVIVGPTWIINPSFPIPNLDIGIPPQPSIAREQILISSDAPGDVEAIEIHYYLPDGIDYDGDATVDGTPQEPVIIGNELIWYIDFLFPQQQKIIEFNIIAIDPQFQILKRWVRGWGFCPTENSQVYGDNVGELNIIDDILPEIENVEHLLDVVEKTLIISCDVSDNWIIDQVKTYISGPNGFEDSYELEKITEDTYEVLIDILEWESGFYSYYIWAMDLGGNEVASSVYDFQIPSETQLLADADGPYEGNIMEDIEFDSTVTGGVPPYEYLWDYGDGNTSSGDPHPTHNYGSAGNYTIILTVTDSEEDTASDTTWTYINAPPNSPIIDGPQQGKEGLKYTYTAITTDPDGDQIFYIWNFSDSIELIETLIPLDSGEICKLNHTFAEKGDYTLRVKSRDIYDAESEWSEPLEISIPKIKIYISSIQIFFKILERFPFFEKILNQIL